MQKVYQAAGGAPGGFPGGQFPGGQFPGGFPGGQGPQQGGSSGPTVDEVDWFICCILILIVSFIYFNHIYLFNLLIIKNIINE